MLSDSWWQPWNSQVDKRNPSDGQTPGKTNDNSSQASLGPFHDHDFHKYPRMQPRQHDAAQPHGRFRAETPATYSATATSSAFTSCMLCSEFEVQPLSRHFKRASRCLAKFSDLFPSRSRWELALVRGHAENCPGCGTRGGRPGQMVTSAELPDYQASGNLSRIRLQIKST